MYKSIFRSDLMTGKVIIVTGGGSGIGRCTAHELASLGAKVVLVGRKEDKLSKVHEEITSDGGEATFYTCDIRDEDAVKSLITDIKQKKDRIDGLVNNAGGQYPSPLSAIKKKGFDAVVATNLTGGFLMAREVFNQSMAKSGGSIVNIIADCANGMPGMGHSGAARAGMENFTKTAALEWADSGVRVNALAPGIIATSGLDTYPPPVQAILPQMAKHIPLSRFGTESEISSAITFLLSEASAYITGVTLKIDGASSLNGPYWPVPRTKGPNEAFNGFHRSVTPEVLKNQEKK